MIKTLSEREIDPFNISPSDLDIGDIAHGLSMVNRWQGGPRVAFSVAQHSLVVSNVAVNVLAEMGAEIHSEAVARNVALAGLLHDAPEYLLGDMNHCVKQRMPEYQALEARVMDAVQERFGISDNSLDMIKFVDRRVAANEAEFLFKTGALRAMKEVKPIEGLLLTPMSQLEAEAMFLQRFRDLNALDQREVQHA
jgi:5'-deoxynucleotidase YfbR-like HD superfamily hydrolase